ncbi:MAG TPA: HD domain-containing protein [Chitinophagaceae bacterium]|jgi:uncharacterized protein|nr:HD domain-containing protein [Chitinophagaceae bacterium]
MDSFLAAWRPRFIAYLEAHPHNDAAHDLHHFHRVWKRCRLLNREEGSIADERVLLAAAYFHDLISLPKNHPDRSRSSVLSAEAATRLLQEKFTDFPAGLIPEVAHAIEAHSFSAGIPPRTPEARILQDADRMEALGAIGIARCFYTAGRLGGQLFHPGDLHGTHRPLDDTAYALDHFPLKLLRLPGQMQTAAGRRMAASEAAFLELFLRKLEEEAMDGGGEDGIGN